MRTVIVSCIDDLAGDRRHALISAWSKLDPSIGRARGACIIDRGRHILRLRVRTDAVRAGHDPEGAWGAALALAAWELGVSGEIHVLFDQPGLGRYTWVWSPERRGDATRHAARPSWTPPSRP